MSTGNSTATTKNWEQDKQVWYFISKNQPGLRRSTQELSWQPFSVG